MRTPLFNLCWMSVAKVCIWLVSWEYLFFLEQRHWKWRNRCDEKTKRISGDRHHLVHILVHIRTYIGTISAVLIFSYEGHGQQLLNLCYFEILKKGYSLIMVYAVRMIQTRMSVRENRHMPIVDTLSQPVLYFMFAIRQLLLLLKASMNFGVLLLLLNASMNFGVLFIYIVEER